MTTPKNTTYKDCIFQFSPRSSLYKGRRDIPLLIPVPWDPYGTGVHKGSVPRPGYSTLTQLHNGRQINSPEHHFFELWHPHSKHQEEATGVNLNVFHIVWVQMDLECHLVRC